MTSFEVKELRPQKRAKDRYNVLAEEGFLLSLSAETIVAHHIRVGSVLDAETLEQLRREDTVKYAKELAADYLGYAPRTQRQLEQHLARKGIDEASIAAAVATCKEYGYIDDAAYARQMAEQYQGSLGERAIREKMRQRGLGREAVAAAVFSPEAQQQAARSLAEKLRKKYAELPADKRRQRIYAALIRKGFSYEEAAELSRGGEAEE